MIRGIDAGRCLGGFGRNGPGSGWGSMLSAGLDAGADWAHACLAPLLSAAVGFLVMAARRLRRRKAARTERRKALEAGVQALLRDRIYGECVRCLQKGFADVDDIRNLESLYRPYHALGGNGTGTELFERVKKMPVSPAERGAQCGKRHGTPS